MGRGLGIFPARQKTPFVPGESTTRDKRPPHITSSFALPLTLGFSSICAWCRRRPLLPPPREPSTAAAIDVAAAQSPDLTPPPRAPTNPPETRRNTAAAVTPSPAPPSPARRRPAATGHPSPRRDYPKVELDLLSPLDTFSIPLNPRTSRYVGKLPGAKLEQIGGGCTSTSSQVQGYSRYLSTISLLILVTLVYLMRECKNHEQKMTGKRINFYTYI